MEQLDLFADLVLVVVGVGRTLRWLRRQESTLGPRERSPSIGRCGRLAPTCLLAATACQPTTEYSGDLPASGHDRTQARPHAGENALGGTGSSPAASGPRWSRSLTTPWPEPGCVTMRRLLAGFDPVTVASKRMTTRPTTQVAIASRCATQGIGNGPTARGPALRSPPCRSGQAHRHRCYGHLPSMTVDEMSDLDLSYTPPLGSPWDASRWVLSHG